MLLHNQVICGDSREVLKSLPDACADALVSDPPAAIGMMNMQWDHNRGGRDQWIAWLAGIMAEARRCIRPGGHALVWALPRTSHWTATAMEDANWRVADVVTHVQSQGFPKSRSLLKPSSEHWILCRAPGPRQELNIDACRVSSRDSTMRSNRAEMGYGGGNLAPLYTTGSDRGRWPSNFALSHVPPAPDGTGGCQPAGVRRMPSDKRGRGRPRGTFPHSDDAWGNGHRAYTGAETAGDGTEVQQEYVCVDGCPVAKLDRQAGPRTSGVKKPHHRRHAAKGWSGPYADDQGGPAFRSLTGGDTGACSRFFKVFPPETPDRDDAAPFRYEPKASRRDRGEGNTHSTVKPTALMAWLCKLVTPPGGTVLDCFAGSGSTLVACVREGFGFIGIEQDSHYCDIARGRIAHARAQLAGPLFAAAEKDA